MALIKCKECGHEVSDKAKICPNCGAKPKARRTFLKYAGGFLVLLLVLAMFKQPPTPSTSAAQAQTSQPEELLVNFDISLETMAGTLVCPLDTVLDNREGHGLQAAMKSRQEVFSRQEDAEKAGCQEWREALPIHLSDTEKKRAKGLQAENRCGMLTFDAGLIYSCDLRNLTNSNSTPQAAGPKTHSGTVRLKWMAPAILSGALASSVYDDCCHNGEESKQKYVFLRPDSKVSIDPDGDDEPGIQNIEAIQIGGTFPNVRDGQHVVIQCKEVSYGFNGHYALPVYCNEPTVQ